MNLNERFSMPPFNEWRMKNEYFPEGLVVGKRRDELNGIPMEETGSRNLLASLQSLARNEKPLSSLVGNNNTGKSVRQKKVRRPSSNYLERAKSYESSEDETECAEQMKRPIYRRDKNSSEKKFKLVSGPLRPEKNAEVYIPPYRRNGVEVKELNLRQVESSGKTKRVDCTKKSPDAENDLVFLLDHLEALSKTCVPVETFKESQNINKEGGEFKPLRKPSLDFLQKESANNRGKIKAIEESTGKRLENIAGENMSGESLRRPSLDFLRKESANNRDEIKAIEESTGKRFENIAKEKIPGEPLRRPSLDFLRKENANNESKIKVMEKSSGRRVEAISGEKKLSESLRRPSLDFLRRGNASNENKMKVIEESSIGEQIEVISDEKIPEGNNVDRDENNNEEEEVKPLRKPSLDFLKKNNNNYSKNEIIQRNVKKRFQYVLPERFFCVEQTQRVQYSGGMRMQKAQDRLLELKKSLSEFIM